MCIMFVLNLKKKCSLAMKLSMYRVQGQLSMSVLKWKISLNHIETVYRYS